MSRAGLIIGPDIDGRGLRLSPRDVFPLRRGPRRIDPPPRLPAPCNVVAPRRCMLILMLARVGGRWLPEREIRTLR